MPKISAGSAAFLLGLCLAGSALANSGNTSDASTIQIVEARTPSPLPVKAVLGHVNTETCWYPNNEAATQASALRQLQDQAAKLGATGIIDVKFYPHSYRGKFVCPSYGATGTAVMFGGGAS